MTTAQTAAKRALQQARMIHPATDTGVENPSPVVSTTFSMNDLPAQVHLAITALGLYRCSINGRNVTDDLLTPGWTAYDLRLSYQVYNVSELLQQGRNHIEIWLADGWLRSQMMWRDVEIYNTWGDKLGALAALFDDNGQTIISTDNRWASGTGPVRKSGIYCGEHFDARCTEVRTDQSVSEMAFDSSILVPQEAPPVRELKPFEPIAQWQDAEDRTVYDFGQNLAGYIAFELEGAAAGDEVIIEHSEIVGPNREFDNRNYRTAAATIVYKASGQAVERYRPHFTFMGYRYARVSISGNGRITAIQSVPISSVDDQTGYFECDLPLVNKLVKNTLWSQRSNFIEVPTDCPQRDERLGWTGDAQVFAGTACYLHDSHRFLRKWLTDVIAEQTDNGAIPHVVPNPVRMNSTHMANFVGSTGWGDVIHVLPLTLWEHYGDHEALETAFPAMLRWIDYVWSISDGPIVRPPKSWDDKGFSFGDWLQPKGPTDKPHATIGDDAAATIYLYIALKNTARVAAIIGEHGHEASLLSKAETVRDAFAHEFITPAGRVAYHDQTSYALTLLHDLVPGQHLETARAQFVNAIRRTGTTIGTGFIGTPALLPALIKVGEYKLAAELFLQESVPGWLYQVKQGATTIWERWDALREDGTAFEPDMNSYNHYAYGAVCQWLFEGVAGIRPTDSDPGFRTVALSPVVLPELGRAAASYRAHVGLIEAAWSLARDQVTYTVTLPEGVSGQFELDEPLFDLTVNGSPAEPTAPIRLDSGKHTISFRLERLNGRLASGNHAA